MMGQGMMQSFLWCPDPLVSLLLVALRLLIPFGFVVPGICVSFLPLIFPQIPSPVAASTPDSLTLPCSSRVPCSSLPLPAAI